ncbi:concanavalin A-like lectin/glucanase [Linderina pennispora]|uniref:Concanavalin A-like lectin/glucanase n=1 Tax=Linderina pennispora TaxID=61395 RepID=A0A1Y1WJL7_9FUNG|nr:concanavalin A-like lectin/glucanase [Linderina pennispora]ORX73545.1 concanavalin A-like lectin/glucanase [Linderina pennispora]
MKVTSRSIVATLVASAIGTTASVVDLSGGHPAGVSGLQGMKDAQMANTTRTVRSLQTRDTRYTCDSAFIDFSKPDALSKFSVAWCPQNTYLTGTSVAMRLTPECGTTMIYPWDFKHGKMEARVRMAAGSGVVSTILLAGPEPADELDVEWTMYFAKGQRVDPNAWYFHTPGDVPQDMSATYHNYAIEVTQNTIKWWIDDWLVRTLNRVDGVPFPSDASRARMGVWDGSKQGGWAGTVDWSKGPFIAEMQWFKFTPYC